MAIVFISDAATQTLAQYDELIKRLEAAGHENPPGRLFHVAARKGDGYFVIDVWESQEALDRFAQILIPLIQDVGGTAPQLDIHPVHNMMMRA